MKTGDKITVRLYSGRLVQGTVRGVTPTVGETKVKILSGQLLLNVNVKQVVKIGGGDGLST